MKILMAIAELLGKLLSGGEARRPKSWGNGYLRVTAMDLVNVAVVVASVTALYFGIKAEVLQARTDTQKLRMDMTDGLRYAALELRELKRLDSLAIATRDAQRRYLWNENQREHDMMWRALHRRIPDRPEYLEPWRYLPDAWNRGEAAPLDRTR